REEGAELLGAVGEHQEDVRHEARLLLHGEDARAHVLGKVLQLRNGIAADRRGHGDVRVRAARWRSMAYPHSTRSHIDSVTPATAVMEGGGGPSPFIAYTASRKATSDHHAQVPVRSRATVLAV